MYLVKTNKVGTELWARTFGGENLEMAHALVETPEGGLAVAGSKYSYGGINEEMYVVRTDSAGNAPSEPGT